jgi:SAM-dependent methyltransferase
MMHRDPDTDALIVERGFKTVLCAGSGISQEPRALAAAGCEVIALDISPAAMRLAQAWNFDPSELEEFLRPEHLKPGGSAQFVVGDLLDPTVCAGPFDLIIERCMLQNFASEERGRALDALIARLNSDGVFISHCHDGGWRPGRTPFHAASDLFSLRGWKTWRNTSEPPPEGRCAWLYQSTG